MERRICVFCASSNKVDQRYFKATEILATQLVNQNITTIYGGGLAGLMGHLANTILSQGGKVIGVLPRFMKNHHLKWGKDVALLITTDAVHYGDEEWGGKNYAPYGTDTIGYEKVIAHEHNIIDSSLVGGLTNDKANKFFNYTVDSADYHEYRWTCIISKEILIEL